MRVIHRKRCGQMKYSRESPPGGGCTHLGQLKLLLSEVEFLTPFYGKQMMMHVVYAGAAPGLHVPILAEMFSTMHFVLVDPAPSMISNGEYPNIEVIQAFMTDALAGHFALLYPSDSLLFISDVRVGAPRGGGTVESDRAHQIRVQRDMDAQRGWLEIMRPLCSILKFRLPWSLESKTEYLGGRIYFPVYGRILTHESRLIVSKDFSVVNYVYKLYEKQMTYFNRVLRPATNYPEFGGNKNNNKCYDCTAFRWIICKYLAARRRRGAGYDDDDVGGSGGGCDNYSVIDEMCHEIERKLNANKAQWLLLLRFFCPLKIK
jgi:hypothetical protein